MRDVQEAAHRAGESIQSGFNDVKRATVGGSYAGDKVSETTNKASNRATETQNRASDAVNDATSNANSR